MISECKIAVLMIRVWPHLC